jgi:hypothetical protein
VPCFTYRLPVFQSSQNRAGFKQKSLKVQELEKAVYNRGIVLILMIIMSMLRILLFSTLLAINFPALAQVYKSTDADGNAVFSDEPSAGSEKVDVPEPNLGDAVKVPEAAPEPAPAPAPAVVEKKKPDSFEGDQDDWDDEGSIRRPRRFMHNHHRNNHRRR